MFPDNICQNSDILIVTNVQKNNFGFHSNRKTQGQKHQLNNLYFKFVIFVIFQVWQIRLIPRLSCYSTNPTVSGMGGFPLFPGPL